MTTDERLDIILHQNEQLLAMLSKLLPKSDNVKNHIGIISLKSNYGNGSMNKKGGTRNERARD